jgi:multidrug efflux pump
MRFTDIFIRRPVLAMVVSLMILVLGLKSMTSLSVLQYPRTQNAIVTVTTTYAGADPDIIAGFITTPLENAIAQANGIDYMTSTSQSGVSTITVNLRLNYDSGKALTEINTKVNSVLNQLPSGSQQPILTIKIGQTIDAMYLGFSSSVLAPNQITDYLTRVVQPKLQSVTGVQTAEILGGKTFALRAWLDPIKLAAYNLTATDVSTALTGNDYIAGLGTTKGQMVQVNLTAGTSLHSLQEFRDLVIKQVGGANIKLSDVANVTLGSDDYESSVSFNGKKAVYIGIQVAPAANLLDVIKGVKDVYPEIRAQQPDGLDSEIVYDSTKFVNASIDDVEKTLIEALVIVTVVVFLFLGSWRSVVIPVIAIPLSLIGTFTMLLALGFTINLLTLLALVLAIGLVVDDAIIVVENVNRHLEEGKTPLQSAYLAARELAGPIIAMTIVLIAVYVPIGFQGGLTGALFTEFAFTLAGSVAVSAVIALTLTPMLSAYILKPYNREHPTISDRLTHFIDARMESLRRGYAWMLTGSLNTIVVTVVFAALVLASIPWLVANSKSELAPNEDQGLVLTLSTPAPNATLQQKLAYSAQAYQKFIKYPETSGVFQIETPAQTIAGWVFKPWDERTRTADQLQPIIQQDMSDIAGVKVVAFQQPPLPGSNGLPIQFVIQTTDPFDQLNNVANEFTAAALKTGQFIFLDSDLKIDRPQSALIIDKQKAAQLGIRLSDIGASLGSMLGGGYVNYFDLSGRSYKVIPQVAQRYRLNADQILNYYIKTGDGTTVPLSTIATLSTAAVPESLNHFQQINAATISGVPTPGVIVGDALKSMKAIADRTLPKGYTVDYAGSSRQFAQESSGFAVTFAFAIIIVFLALAAQFESFRDPLIILMSVPMSLAGALVFIMLGLKGLSLNIYTEVGLVTLMGLISKHGILIVEFANELQHAGRTKREAIIEATGIRLRPILMTTAAMVLGVVPLILSTGAGAASRVNMGVVIAAGLAIGTLFTLFVVPAFYLLLGANHAAKADENIDPIDGVSHSGEAQPHAV